MSTVKHRRAREALNGTKTLLWPGIDIDIPTDPDHSKCTPDGTRNAVFAAFRGGADGVILSRKYSEMKLAICEELVQQFVEVLANKA